MIIQAGSVTMSSERSYSRVQSSTSMTAVSKAEDAVKVDISDKSKGMLKQLQDGLEEKEQAKKEEEAAKKEKQKQAFLNLAEQTQTQRTDEGMKIQPRSKEDLELEMLREELEG